MKHAPGFKKKCGCIIRLYYEDNTIESVEIEYCPIHAAAPELLEALDRLLQDYHNGNNMIDAYNKASKVIIRAAPPDDVADATLEKE